MQYRCDRRLSGNHVGDAGASALAEAAKVDATLLTLECVCERDAIRGAQSGISHLCRHVCGPHCQSGSIGAAADAGCTLWRCSKALRAAMTWLRQASRRRRWSVVGRAPASLASHSSQAPQHSDWPRWGVGSRRSAQEQHRAEVTWVRACAGPFGEILDPAGFEAALGACG